MAIGLSPAVCALIKALGLEGQNCAGLDIRIRPEELIQVKAILIAGEASIERLGDLILERVNADALGADEPILGGA